MARQRIPRFEPPPAVLSNMGDINRASIMSVMSELSASAASASAASASSLSAAQAQSTADTYSYGQTDGYTSSSASSTTETLGVVVPASTASNPAATQTESFSSMVTSPAPTAAQTTNPSTSSTKSTAAAASDHASNEPDSSLATADRGYHTGPSSGQIAAAVVIPLVVLLALGFGLFYLRRRRRRRSAAFASQQYDHHHHPMTDRSAFAKEAAVLPKPSPSRPPRSVPILTTTTNNAYYTGLSTPTTPSRASTQTRGHASADTDRRAMSPYDIPPPAYAKHAPPGSTPTLPQLSFAADPFMDPVSPVPSEDRDAHSPTAAALAALSGRDTHPTATSLSPVSNFSRPHGGVSRTATMRSIGAASFASDMYSDTASVHSARPARMSGGAAVETQVVNRLSAGEGSFAPGLVVGSGRGDPFGDPR